MTKKSFAAFEKFKPKSYEFEVTTPDGDTIEFSMRALTQAELLAIDMDHPRPQPQVVDFIAPTKKGEKPIPVYSSDDNADEKHKREWSKTVNDWLQNHRNRQIIAALEMDIPGDTLEEQLEAMESLGAWAISAFSQALELVIKTSQAALTARNFRTG